MPPPRHVTDKQRQKRNLLGGGKNRCGEGDGQESTVLAYVHYVSKNVAPLVCYNVEIRERILILFGRNVTDKVSNQKTLYYATPNNLCFCTTWQNGETRKSHFSLKCCNQCCIIALPEFNSSLFDFFSLFDTWLVLMLLYDSLNLAINARGCWGYGSGERKSERRSSWTVLHTQCICTNVLLPER